MKDLAVLSGNFGIITSNLIDIIIIATIKKNVRLDAFNRYIIDMNFFLMSRIYLSKCFYYLKFFWIKHNESCKPMNICSTTCIKIDNLMVNLKLFSNYKGGHTIGTSHCVAFGLRLYNFSGKGDTDPSMDPTYVTQLKQKCKPGDTTSLVEMDPGSFKTFDEAYYTLVSKRRGLFDSDAALLNNAETKAYVLQASRRGSTFAKDFAVSMVKMGKVEVLTGNQGEIRKHCAMVN